MCVGSQQVNHDKDIEVKSKIEKCESPNQIYFVTCLLAIQGAGRSSEVERSLMVDKMC